MDADKEPDEQPDKKRPKRGTRHGPRKTARPTTSTDSDDLRDLIAATRRRLERAATHSRSKRARKLIESSRASLDRLSSFAALKRWARELCDGIDSVPGDEGLAQVRLFAGGMCWWKGPRCDVLIRLAELGPLAQMGLPLPRKVLAESSILAPEASSKATVYAEQALAQMEPAAPELDDGVFATIFAESISVDVPADELEKPTDWFQEIDAKGRATSAPHAAMALPERERAATAVLKQWLGQGHGVVLVSWHVSGISAMVSNATFLRHWPKIVRAVLGHDAIALPLRPDPALWALAWHHRGRVQIGERRARWPHRFDIQEYDREDGPRAARERE